MGKGMFVTLVAPLVLVLSISSFLQAQQSAGDFLQARHAAHWELILFERLCADGAVHPELRESCARALEVELASMDITVQMLRNLTGSASPPISMELQRDLARLGATGGRELEKAVMFRITEVLLREAPELQRSREIYNLSQELRAAEQARAEVRLREAQSMERWLCDWYQECRAE